MNADGLDEPSFFEKIFTAKDTKKHKGNAARTLNSKRGRTLENKRNPQQTPRLSDLAAHNGPSFGFRARLLRNNCVDYRARDNALDPALG
jgi:hypothetical protein